MALRNIFKRKKPPQEKKDKKEVEKPLEKEKEIKKEKEVKKEKLGVLKKGRKIVKKELAYKILKTPHITEKATELAKKNQYVFKVYPRANKTEIKKAIEQLYGVQVLAVKIIHVPPKERRVRRIKGWRKGYKKAIVKIRKGQKIEILPR